MFSRSDWSLDDILYVVEKALRGLPLEEVSSRAVMVKGKQGRRVYLRRAVESSLLGILIAAGVLFGVWTFFRRAKTRTRTYQGSDRFDLIDEVSHDMADYTDISKASLDELEAALLKIENELAGLEANQDEVSI